MTMYRETGRHERPHFHARYAEFKASIAIDPPVVMAGSLPRRQERLALAWAELHRDELLENWRRLGDDELPLMIAVLQ
ncbi:MAG: DUF4160 domain-containing protein [Caldilineaceae bacterium]|nr:DUF4160 domain-containing protein [Caldilineaceae bacterium]MBP8123028.1 DUF4160 domain-containing protein [Caldilineaceae bacterium]